MQNAYGCGTIQTVWYLDREMTKYDENFAAINAAVAQMDDAIQSIPPTPFFDDLTAEDAALQQTTLYEAARIDGYGWFGILLYIVLPLSRAAIATIGLYTAVFFWNDWFYSLIYLNRDHHYHDSAHPDLSLPAKAF